MNSNVSHLVLKSERRTAAINSPDFHNNNGSNGIHLVIDVTDIHGVTPGITATIQGKDPISGKYYTILASASIVAVSTTVIKVFPGAPVAANVSANDCIPKIWRVAVTVADADACTYSIAANMLA